MLADGVVRSRALIIQQKTCTLSNRRSTVALRKAIVGLAGRRGCRKAPQVCRCRLSCRSRVDTLAPYNVV